MPDFWRRQAIQSELFRGTVIRNGDDFLGETDPGRVVESGVFECGPCGDRPAHPLRPIRLHVQARVGVAVRTVRHLPTSGQTRDLTWENLISLGARGGHEDQAYIWVQIYSEADEQIRELDGGTRVENIISDFESPTVGGADNRFPWAGRNWSIDNDQTGSARYPLAQPTLGSPNCETVYDGPTSQIPLRQYLEDHPTIREVTKTTQFHSFLYQIPLLSSDRASVFLPRLRPTASVAWSFDETLGRESAGGQITVTQQRYRVHYIHPNGVAPPGMVSALWRVFHGR